MPTRPDWARSIGNLLNNASKFTDKGGRIELTVSVEGREEDSAATTHVDHDDVSGRDPDSRQRHWELPRINFRTSLSCSCRSIRRLERSGGGLGIGLDTREKA